MALALTGFSAQYELDDQTVRLHGFLNEDASQVTLNWEWQNYGVPVYNNMPDQPVELELFRRHPDNLGASNWVSLGTFFPYNGETTYVDDLGAGDAWEYRIYRAPNQDTGDFKLEAGGYFVAGREVALKDDNGIVLVYVDSTIENDLSAELETLYEDLAGDGYEVRHYSVPRHGNMETAQIFRDTVQKHLSQDAGVAKTVYLVGRVPFVKSGPVCPDQHCPGTEVLTDQFIVSRSDAWVDGDDDGKFDQDQIPSPSGSQTHTLAPVGRVDLAGMKAWQDSLDPGLDEIALMKRYFDKNHKYRHAITKNERRTIWDNLAFDDTPFESEAAKLMMGLENSVKGDFIDDPDDPSDINGEDPSTSYQWGIDFSSWKGTNYPNYQFRLTFFLNFGSGKMKVGSNDNPIRAILCMPEYGLAGFWGVRPNWYIHNMGLGYTIGDAQFRSVNTTADDYVPVDDYSYYAYEHGIWINLMGDPTLKILPPEPASDLLATPLSDGVSLSWTASGEEGLVGYHVYRSDNKLGPYTRQTASPVSGTSWSENGVEQGEYFYMVRAVTLESTGMGTYYQASQGIFTQVAVDGTTPVTETVVKPELVYADGVWNITLVRPDRDARIMVTDSRGRLVQAQSSIGQNGAFSLRLPVDAPPGVYMVQVSSKGGNIRFSLPLLR